MLGGKFRDLRGLLTASGALLKVKGKIYRARVQSLLVYGSETWPMKEDDMQRLERTENSMVRWMSGAGAQEPGGRVVPPHSKTWEGQT